MRLSIVQAASIRQAYAAIADAQKADDSSALLTAFADFAIVCDSIERVGLFGWLKKAPSEMTIFEFLTYLNKVLPKYAQALADDHSLIQALGSIKAQ